MLRVWFILTIVFGGIITIATDSTFLGLLLGMLLAGVVTAIFAWLVSLKENHDKQKRERAVEKDTWVFPVEEFYKWYIALVGKIPANIKKESDYQRAIVIVERTLENNGVDKQYYPRYTNRDSLEKYFSTIAKNKNSYPKTVTYKPQEWEQTRLTDSMPNVREKDLIGRDKAVYYFEQKIIECRSVIEACKQTTNTLVNGAEATYQLGKQKESSWAVHGGIASAIAGPVAGAAVAIDVESKNIEVRQHNQALRSAATGAVVPTLMDNVRKQGLAEEELERLIKSRTNATYKLVDFSNPKELLAKLNPVATIAQKTPKTVSMKITLHSIPDLVIYGDIPAAVDGSIKVRLKVDGRSVGTTTCIFPLYGIRDSKVELSCSCPVKEANADYQIELLPNRLWAIEKP